MLNKTSLSSKFVKEERWIDSLLHYELNIQGFQIQTFLECLTSYHISITNHYILCLMNHDTIDKTYYKIHHCEFLAIHSTYNSIRLNKISHLKPLSRNLCVVQEKRKKRGDHHRCMDKNLKTTSTK